MALRLAFLVCCALTGAGVKLLEAPVGATTVLITSNALVVLVMLLVFFWKETPSAVESSDTNEPHKVLEKLLEYEVPLQNIPSDPQKGENLVEAFKNSEGKIIVRDPDGYYLELCNCDVPDGLLPLQGECQGEETRLCPEVQETHGCHMMPCSSMLSTYNEEKPKDRRRAA